jgi:iron uptake system component EfeO
VSVSCMLMTSAPARHPGRSPTFALFVAAALGVALVSACGNQPTSAAAGLIRFNSSSCGADWAQPRAGQQTLRIRNDSAAGAEIDLIDPANGAVYGEADDIGPGTTASMSVDLGSGRYAFRCLIEDSDAVTGPVVRIGGRSKGEPAIAAVTSNDLIGPAKQYQVYVTAGLKSLVPQVRALDSAVRSGKLVAARRAWLPAHLTYERLGAAYGTFGDFDDEIDSNANGLVGGVTSADFTGFYRIEYGLWHGQSAKTLTAPADALLHAALTLQKAWPAMEVSLLDVGLRTHEILENALQFQLTGEDDYGSGTTLATVTANIAGTEELLAVLHPLLVSRYHDLPQVYTDLSGLQRLLQAQQHPDGSWTPVSRLPDTAREQIDAATGQALQDLAPIAVITEPRRTS